MLKLLLATTLGLALTALAVLGAWLLLKPSDALGTQEPVAEVMAVEGDAFRRAFLTSEWFLLEKGSDIFHRDEVKTGDDSTIKVKLLQDGQELEFSEKTLVEIKRRALAVSGGTVENQSKAGSGNPFAISVGDVKVVMDTRVGELSQVTGEGAMLNLLLSKWEKGQKVLRGNLLVSWADKMKGIEGKSSEYWQSSWAELDQAISFAEQERQNVIISKDEKTGKVRAQVSEGSISLEMNGQFGSISVKEGEGLIMEEGSSEAKRVKLLPSPMGLKPEEGILFNVNELKLSWEPLAGALNYKVQVSGEDSFSNLLYDDNVSSTSLTLEARDWRGQIFWRVWGVDENGFEGAKGLVSLDLQEDRTPPALLIEDLKL
jgi:hypothetical protein